MFPHEGSIVVGLLTLHHRPWGCLSKRRKWSAGPGAHVTSARPLPVDMRHVLFVSGVDSEKNMEKIMKNVAVGNNYFV